MSVLVFNYLFKYIIFDVCFDNPFFLDLSNYLCEACLPNSLNGET